MGLITVTLPTIGEPRGNGETDVRNALQSIVNEINGLLSAQNLADGAVTLAKLATEVTTSLNAKAPLASPTFTAGITVTQDAVIRSGATQQVAIGNVGGVAGINFGTGAGLANLYLGGTDILKTDDRMNASQGFEAPVGSGIGAFHSREGAVAQHHFVMFGTGKMEWGDGTNARDTNFYRDPAGNKLKTDDIFEAVGGLVHTRSGGSATVPRIVRGRVQAAGTASGTATGFTVSRTSAGVYLVDFTPDFSSAPAVKALPDTVGILSSYGALSAGSVEFVFRTSAGVATDTGFCFEAVSVE